MAEKSVNDLLSEIRIQQRATSRLRCSMGVVLSQLDPQDREAVQQALADHSIFGSTIAKVLKARGYEVKSLAVNRHRRRTCACED